MKFFQTLLAKRNRKRLKDEAYAFLFEPYDFEYALSPPEGIERFLQFIGPPPLAGYYLEFDVAMINR